MADHQRYVNLLFFVLFSCFVYSSYGYQFIVGGRDGWVLNPSENYNQWAGRMRFQVNDTLLFKYKNGSDSVLVVNKDDYDKCNTANPILKLDNGNSVFKFDRSGPFYFISGNKSNCDQGQKLIVVVMAVRNRPPLPPNTPPQGSSPSPSPSGGAGSAPAPANSSSSPSPSGAAPTPANSPSSPSPSGGASTPANSPLSPSPSGGATTPANSPMSPSPSGGAPAPANSPESPSPTSEAPNPAAGSPGSPSSTTPGSPSSSTPGSPSSSTPGSPNTSTPGSGTPADVNASPPAPQLSLAAQSCAPSAVLIAVVSVVLSVAFGRFII